MLFLQGCCLDILPLFSRGCVDFVLTDPPYITSYQDRSGRSLKNDDNDAWLKPAFSEIYRVLAKDSYAVSFYGWHQADKFVDAWKSAGFRIAGHLVFPKGYASSEGHIGYWHESAYLLAKGSPKPQHLIPDVLPWKYTGNKLHPTQKPVEALKPLITAFSKPGAWVLDPFAGSGSTLAAAKETGRDYFGIELDPGYYAKACKRLGYGP